MREGQVENPLNESHRSKPPVSEACLVETVGDKMRKKMAAGSHPVFSAPITLCRGPVRLIILRVTDVLRKFARSFTSARTSAGWEWSVDGIN